MGKAVQSVEPRIAERGNSWLTSYGVDYQLEHENSACESITAALQAYVSKTGGAGGNRVDVKLLLTDKHGNKYPVLIEYKGYRNRLVKLTDSGQVANRNSAGELLFSNIDGYAVNGAVHYANALLQHTRYEQVIAVGMTGYVDEQDILRHEIGVYLVSHDNLGAGQSLGGYTDFSFLHPNNFQDFLDYAHELSMPPHELLALREARERNIEASLIKLNNDMYGTVDGLSEGDRLNLVAATIISTLTAPGFTPLHVGNLRSSQDEGERDGDVMLRKVGSFLKAKNIPGEKLELIKQHLSTTILNSRLNFSAGGDSKLKILVTKIYENLGHFYTVGLSTDFTGKLFNEMYAWLGFSQDTMNDVVLTPTYVATLLSRLARVNKDSHVLDITTGSGGLLVAAMNEMIIDAKQYNSPSENTRNTIERIKTQQLLGVEILPNVYVLAVLNMILAGGSASNILNCDSLKDFRGETVDGSVFPANALVLNPPYSAPGNGMCFVASALRLMHRGYAAVLIRDRAGSGNAVSYAKEILKQNTLIASILMPPDLFFGKAKVQTRIYVFKIGEKHSVSDTVKFIDFTVDGYLRSARKKSQKKLVNTGDAAQRYSELAHLVRFGSLSHDSTGIEYFDGRIDPNNGADWNQSKPVQVNLTVNDFQSTVNENTTWQVDKILESSSYNKCSAENTVVSTVGWQEFAVGDLFEKVTVKKLSYLSANLPTVSKPGFTLPALTASSKSNGLSCYVPRDGVTVIQKAITVGEVNCELFYQPREFTVLHNAYAIQYRGSQAISDRVYLFIVSVLRQSVAGVFTWEKRASWGRLREIQVLLPVCSEGLDTGFMEEHMRSIESRVVASTCGDFHNRLVALLSVTGNLIE